MEGALPLIDVIVVLAIAAVGLVLGRLIRLPSVVAYLLAGVVVGPGVLGWVDRSHHLEQLAELGVALLLFGVGIEFSLSQLWRILGPMLMGGGLQVTATATVTALGFRWLGFDWAVAAFIGLLMSLSSTAIVFKLYGDSDELQAPQGQAATAILLFQDLALVPMVLLVPVLAGLSAGGTWGAARALFSAAAALGLLLLAARVILPAALRLVARTGTPELFPIAALVAAFGTAAGAVGLGLSLPIGAFLAGLALSESPYGRQVFAEIVPLRDAFVAVFFTGIGALVDPRIVAAEPTLAVSMLLAVVLKGALVAGVVAAVWRSRRLALVTGLGLAQVGEFSFVLAREGVGAGLIGRPVEQAFLGAAILSMAATPYLLWLGRRLAILETSSAPRRPRDLRDHILLLGCGETGLAIARVLREMRIDFVAVDLVASHVEQGRREGLPVRFGDAARRVVLDELGAAHARVVVVALGDPGTTRRCVSLLRQLNPSVRILARVQSAHEIRELERLGATDVIPSKLETSIEVLTRLLHGLGVPRHMVRIQESMIRLDHYQAMRQAGPSTELSTQIQKLLVGGMLETAQVGAGSPVEGRSLAELDLRKQAGTQVLSVVRADSPLPSVSAETRLVAGDLVVLYGAHAGLERALRLFDPVESSDPDPARP